MPHHEEHPARLHGSGLRNLRERAEMTGGQFSISSLANGGTSAQIIWQLAPDECGDNRQAE
jgi:signal transduction histidine kinase